MFAVRFMLMTGKRMFLALVGAIVCLVACQEKGEELGHTKVVISTSMGDITLRLYDDTPQHRDNFIRMARSGAYDGIIWHRVVNNSLIQSGDPKLTATGCQPKVDTTQFHHTVPAEIHYPRHFHKAGALAAARQPDSINPGKVSDGCQFYIVSGQVYTPTSLAELWNALYQAKVQELADALRRKHAMRLKTLRATDNVACQALQDSIQTACEEQVAAHPPVSFSDAQKKVYTTKGGAAHLDNEYTVFGEVVDGMKVVEALSKVRTNAKEHPLKEISIRKVTVKE